MYVCIYVFMCLLKYMTWKNGTKQLKRNNWCADAVQLWDLKKRQLKTIFKTSEAGRDPHTHSPAAAAKHSVVSQEFCFIILRGLFPSNDQGDLVTTVCFMPTGELVCSGDQVA